MIEHELVLLGLLKESPKHGYEIKKKIKEILSLFAGVELKSIYYPLQILEKRGLVVKRKNKQGRRPQRLVYELTPKGQSRFNELLAKSFLNFKRPRFSLDLSLYFLGYMKPEIAKRRLQARMQILDRVIRGLKQMINSLKKRRLSSLVNILEHNLQMVETESKFLAQLIGTL
ncbi:MAG: PadR family transcriptional regulator [Candidatus Omnitrophica bacterium]|nr:PadR family transcriptional regulator [Candidatus Omnitrophota bacterium]MDD5237693.1 PadR family transcriptional regulator [Candidatus Omnitrophota bacterium]